MNAPFLRSPPFPGVSAAACAVSTAIENRASAALSPAERVRALSLVHTLRHHRVGGAFWDARRDPWTRDDAEGADAALVRSLRSDTVTDDVLKLVHDQIVAHAAYRNPFTNESATPEQTIELLGFWRAQMERNPGFRGGTPIGVGIAWWKRRQVSQLLWSGGARPMRFAATSAGALRRAAPGERTPIVAWPSRVTPTLRAQAEALGIDYIQIEDGFIRSVGLGAQCHPPFSIVVDRLGVHYDPSRRSELEQILAETDFTVPLLARADTLIALIRTHRISKYESGGTESLPDRDRRRILVTGQVEDDQSVICGGGDIAGNLDLLRRARAVEPDAEIWFKPHPDVEAGHRSGKVDDADALVFADRVIRDVPMPALFDAIDGIHVLTSLAGFEALLRGVEVTTHGVPFYAGWGLTRDLGPVPARRNRALSVTQLAAGVLLLYPRYLDPVTNIPCTPEVLISRLSAQGSPQKTWLTRARHLQGLMSRFLGLK